MLSFVPVTLDLYRTVRRHLHWTLQNLVAFADRTGQCFPSVRTLAAATGQPRSTVSRHLAQLAQEGVIARQRRPGGVYALRHRGPLPAGARGVSHREKRVSHRREQKNRQVRKQGRATRAIRQIRSELRRDARRARQVGGAAARLAQVRLLAAAVGPEAGRAGLLRAGRAAASGKLIPGPQ